MGAYSYSGTAASNTSIDGIDAQGSASPANLDNINRAQAAALANFVRDLGGANTVGGTADAITISLADATTLPAYFDGMLVGAIIGSDNLTTTPTLNVDSVGAKVIKKASAGAEADLAAGDLQAGAYVLFRYRSAWNTAGGAWEALRFDAATLPQSLSTVDSPTFADVTTTDDVQVGDDLLFPNSGSVINFGSGDVLVTYTAETLQLTGGGWNVIRSGATTLPPLYLSNTSDQASVAVARFDGDRATPAANDAAFLDFRLSDSAGNQDAFARLTWKATDVTSTSEDGRLVFSLAAAGSLTDFMTLDTVTGLTINRGFSRGAPVTKTGNFTVADSENWIIINMGSQCTVTLPAAASYPGREIMFKSITGNGAISASSNVVDSDSATAGTALLPSNDGAWCTLVSDGTNWITMAYGQ